jgi:hypothetical protein
MTAKDLAERCRRMGAPSVTASVIANIESGRPDEHGRRRRNVTLEEWLILAQALHVAPIHLLVPVDGEDVRYQLTPEEPQPTQGLRRESAGWVRAWIRGEAPLTFTDERTYGTEVPTAEWKPYGGKTTIERVILEALQGAGVDLEAALRDKSRDEGKGPERG